LFSVSQWVWFSGTAAGRQMIGKPEQEKPGDREQRAEGSRSSRRPPYVSFRGNCVHAVDEKGRVSLPSDFRKVLGEGSQQSVVLTNYISEGSRCIEGFALDAWEDFEARLREKSRFSSKLQRLENFYLSRASECPVDSNGRILVPAYLRQYAGLEREVVFTASIHGFRIWDKRVWDTIFAASEQALLENPDLFADVDI
jgi:MraZ protein